MTPVPPGPLQAPTDRAGEYARQSRSESTLRAYESDWRGFCEWWRLRYRTLIPQAEPIPSVPSTIGAYIAHLADTGKKPATIQRHLAAIACYHRAAGHADPTKHEAVKAAMQGIRRALGTAQKGKAPLLTNDLARLLQFVPATPIGIRDRAIILLGFAGAFRRSELASLNVEDIAWEADGMRINLGRSKTDQTGEGVQVGVLRGQTDLCPCAAVEAWLKDRDEKGAGCQELHPPFNGPFFVHIRRYGRLTADRLNGSAIGAIVKKYAKAAGMNPADFAGHSLRAGFATQAILNNVQDQLVMRQTRHKSAAVFAKYVRPAKLFRDNASGKVGL